jgi:XTP/dITP diphosphohydrolase
MGRLIVNRVRARTLKAALASRNEHKLHELEVALPGWELELLDADGYPPEEGETYYENARGKAVYGRTAAPGDAWVLGEDSGIEVEGLGGEPGVHSARWHEGRGEVPALLERLEGVDGGGRRARYVCELVAVAPDGTEARGTGVLRGRIADAPSGTGGFGYDPIFVPEGETRTVADLGDAWKRENSHRARAARALAAAVS